MSKVKSLLTGVVSEVPDDHFSLSSKDYEVVAEGEVFAESKPDVSKVKFVDADGKVLELDPTTEADLIAEADKDRGLTRLEGAA